jgi:hypothetical protein
VKETILSFLELAGLLIQLVAIVSVIALVFSIPLGILVLVVRMAWGW